MASIALAKGKNPFGSKKKVFAVMVKTLMAHTKADL